MIAKARTLDEIDAATAASRAACVRIFDYTPRLEQVVFLAAREAFGVPAEVEFDIGSFAHEYVIMSEGPGQPEISVRHNNGTPVDNPRYMDSDQDPAVVVWVSDNKVDVPAAVARMGEKLDRFGVAWDAQEWTGPGARMTPMDVARDAFPTATQTVDHSPLDMPKPATARPAPASAKSLRRKP